MQTAKRVHVSSNHTRLALSSLRDNSEIPPSPFFVQPLCSNTSSTGLYCNISSLPCDMAPTYACLCAQGFNGTNCELDLRPCKPTTCLHGGKVPLHVSDDRNRLTSFWIILALCTTLLQGNFSCACASGWEGTNCESMINVCRSVTCLNQGVCRPLPLLAYECLCVSDFSGQHCETRSTRTATLQVVAKSFVSVAAFAIGVVVGFAVTLDVLKYVFNIDPVHEEREQVRRERHPVKQSHPPIRLMERVTYIPWAGHCCFHLPMVCWSSSENPCRRFFM